MRAAGCCRGPGGYGSEEKRCGDRKSEDDGASAGTGYCRVGICFGGISMLLRPRSRDARRWLRSARDSSVVPDPFTIGSLVDNCVADLEVSCAASLERETAGVLLTA